MAVALFAAPVLPAAAGARRERCRPPFRTPSCSAPSPESPTPADWRAFRANLLHQHLNPTAPAPSHFAHLLPNPESGALLLAHPSYFSASQRYFHQSVILLFSHTSHATAGLILNKTPTDSDMPYSPWPDVVVNLGGDVGVGSLFAVYPSPKGAQGLLEGVSVGTVKEAMELEILGNLAKRDIRFFSRYCGWAPNQLQREVDSGVWYVASVAAELVLGDPRTLYHTVMARLGLQAVEDGA